MWLHEQIHAKRFPNCRNCATALEASSKTIQRDIDFMRDRLGLPIAYDAQRFGFYYYEEPEKARPFPWTVARMALHNFGPTTRIEAPPPLMIAPVDELRAGIRSRGRAVQLHFQFARGCRQRNPTKGGSQCSLRT